MNKKEFFAKHSARAESITLDDGTELEILEISAKQRAGFLDMFKDKGPTYGQAYLVAASCSMFDENDSGDIESLLELPSVTLSEIADAVSRFNGFGGDEETEIKND